MFLDEFMITLQTTDSYEQKQIELFFLDRQISFAKNIEAKEETNYIIRPVPLTSLESKRDFVIVLKEFFDEFSHLFPLIENITHRENLV